MNKKVAVVLGGCVIALIAIFFVIKAITAVGAKSQESSPVVKVAAPVVVNAIVPPQTSQKDDDESIKKYTSQIEKSTNDTESSYFALAAIYDKRKEYVKAREVYKKIIEKFSTSPNIQKAQELLDNANIGLLFSSTITPDSFLYEVEPGDMLNKIAKKFGTTPELIIKSNNLKDTKIKFGKKLKITKSKFSISADKSQNILLLKADGEIVKTYRVSTGKDGCTPVGTFKIVNKIVDPTWYTDGAVVPPTDPKNILGTRWLGIDKEGYGIHGTTEPDAIGQSVTSGCIRMKNAEVEELYVIVPVGTEVVVVD